jgi:hypothetical protein
MLRIFGSGYYSPMPLPGVGGARSFLRVAEGASAALRVFRDELLRYGKFSKAFLGAADAPSVTRRERASSATSSV